MIRFIFLLILIPVFVSIAAFSYRNAIPVSVDYFTASIQLPLSVILLLSLFVGAIIGFLINFMWLLSLKAKIRQLNKKTNEMASLSDVFKKPNENGRR